MAAPQDPAARAARQNADRTGWAHHGPYNVDGQSHIYADDKDECFQRFGCVPATRPKNKQNMDLWELTVTGPAKQLDDALNFSYEIIQRNKNASRASAPDPNNSKNAGKGKGKRPLAHVRVLKFL